MFTQTINKNRNIVYLALTITFITLFGYWLWQIWPSILMTAFKWQRENNAQISQLFYAIKAHKNTAYLSLIWISFLYGAVHSIGPGHGKIIVTTFLATHPTKTKQALLLTIGSAIMQAIVAITLVSVLLFIFHGSMREVNSEVLTLVNLSLGAVILLGAFIVYKSGHQLWHAFKQQKIEDDDDHCCEIPSAESINHATSWKSHLSIIMSIGIRPCTGAIMVLLFSKVIGLYWIGIISALLMAVGTAITTSTIALLTISGKKMIRKYISASDHHISLGQLYLQLIGGIILIAFGALLIKSSVFNILLNL